MFNKQKVQEFRSDFAKSVAQLEKQYGVNVTLGTISFNENELRAKMTARVGNAVPSMSRNDFNVGNIVTINHKKVNPNDQFTILKINSKNIKVEKVVDSGLFPGSVGAIINVSPSLLVKK